MVGQGVGATTAALSVKLLLGLLLGKEDSVGAPVDTIAGTPVDMLTLGNFVGEVGCAVGAIGGGVG